MVHGLSQNPWHKFFELHQNEFMEPKRNSSSLPEENTSLDRQSDAARINDEDNLDTREISHSVEEGDEDYDDEELSDADFDIDEEEEDERDDEVL